MEDKRTSKLPMMVETHDVLFVSKRKRWPNCMVGSRSSLAVSLLLGLVFFLSTSVVVARKDEVPRQRLMVGSVENLRRHRRSHLAGRYHDTSSTRITKIERRKTNNRKEKDEFATRDQHGSSSRRRSQDDHSYNNKHRRVLLASSSSEDLEPKSEISKSGMWPPWPLNLLTGRRHDGRDPEGTIASSSGTTTGGRGQFYKRSIVYVSSFLRQQARVGGQRLQEVGSQLWFHLPPATPPLILMASIPIRQIMVTSKNSGALEVVVQAADEAVTRTILPLFSNPFVRTMALSGMALSILSWSHYELHRKRHLTALPLQPQYREVNRAILPHFLPERVFEESEQLLLDEKKAIDGGAPPESDTNSTRTMFNYIPKQWKRFKHWLPKERPKSIPTMWDSLKQRRQSKKKHLEHLRRMSIYDELVALQAVKEMAKKAAAQNKRKKSWKNRLSKKEEGSSSTSDANENDEKTSDITPEDLGFALVTGASRGLGRAMAVELARWEIPLILVARDLDRLTALAYDIENCYGVPCIVLQADLSQPMAAEHIHKATTGAGLAVDILVNNAGLSIHNPLAVNLPLEDVERMIQVNVMSVGKLSHLYGRDMKERRRGRILIVSSMVGAVAAGPSVAVYAATKAFEKSLSLSMGKEMEPHGVGITCLLPGAVRDTDFKLNSSTQDALCWKIPFYPKAPKDVAHSAVQALLRGDTQVIPGWQNRVFLKVLQPSLPQRMHNIMVEWAWNPLPSPPWNRHRRRHRHRHEETAMSIPKQRTDDDAPVARLQPIINPLYGIKTQQLPPRLLTLPSEENTQEDPPIIKEEINDGMQDNVPTEFIDAEMTLQTEDGSTNTTTAVENLQQQDNMDTVKDEPASSVTPIQEKEEMEEDKTPPLNLKSTTSTDKSKRQSQLRSKSQTQDSLDWKEKTDRLVDILQYEELEGGKIDRSEEDFCRRRLLIDW